MHWCYISRSELNWASTGCIHHWRYMGWVFNAMFFANKKGNHTSQLLFGRQGKREQLCLQEKPEFILPVQLQVKPQSRLDFFFSQWELLQKKQASVASLKCFSFNPTIAFCENKQLNNSHLLGSDPLVLNTSSDKKGVDVGVCPGWAYWSVGSSMF